MTKTATHTRLAVSMLLAALSACAASCGSCSQPAAAPSGKTPGSAEAPGTASGQTASGQAAESEGAGTALERSGQPAGRTPEVLVMGVPRAPNRVEISVRNRGGKAVSLSREVRIERQAPDGWKPFRAQGVSLRWSCDSRAGGQDRAAKCLQLVPGAEFLPPAWRAASGKSQCTCEPCKPAPAGRYRFVLQGCKREYRIQGEPFELDFGATRSPPPQPGS